MPGGVRKARLRVSGTMPSMFAVRSFTLDTAVATVATVGARAISIKTTTIKG